MDAVKFIEERNRMCAANKEGCAGCPANSETCFVSLGSSLYAGEQVKIVEKWSAEHPRKTRQKRFLEMFPNAARDARDVLNICPKLVDVDVSCTDDETERTGLCKACDDCREEYWDKEKE